MKGKGKVQDKDCPLLFPDLDPVDHVKHCPKYTSSKAIFMMINVRNLLPNNPCFIETELDGFYKHCLKRSKCQ